MKLLNIISGAAAVIAIGAAAPLVWAQATEPSAPNGTTSVAPAAVSPAAPAEKVAPPISSGTSGASAQLNGAATTQSGSRAINDAEIINSAYVHKKISQAQAEGRDVSAAMAQARMGDAAASKGMNDDAARHYTTALRAIGAMPAAPTRAASPNRAPGAFD